MVIEINLGVSLLLKVYRKIDKEWSLLDLGIHGQISDVAVDNHFVRGVLLTLSARRSDNIRMMTDVLSSLKHEGPRSIASAANIQCVFLNPDE